MCEHVWEHLTEQQGREAARLWFSFLKPGGFVRCAVPGVNFPDADHQRLVHVGGPGPADHPAADHQGVYDDRTFAATFELAGFEVDLLESCDEDGRFHYNRCWDVATDPIYRSLLLDHRNRDDQLEHMTKECSPLSERSD